MKGVLLISILMLSNLYADASYYMEQSRNAYMDGDHKKRYYWLEKAVVEENYAPAITHIGHMHYNGEGTIRDYEKAFTLYSFAAEQNFADAQYHLGEIYYYGKGKKQDYEKAFDFYEAAAEQDHVSAQYMLAKMYYLETGDLFRYLELSSSSSHIDEAKEWASRSAQNGYDKAKKFLQQIEKEEAEEMKRFFQERKNRKRL